MRKGGREDVAERAAGLTTSLGQGMGGKTVRSMWRDWNFGVSNVTESVGGGRCGELGVVESMGFGPCGESVVGELVECGIEVAEEVEHDGFNGRVGATEITSARSNR